MSSEPKTRNEWGKQIECCSICGGPVSFVTNSVVYGADVGDDPHIYLCDDEKCCAYVGVHPGTDQPLGTMADEATRRARQVAHAAFDQVWKSGKMRRRDAYEWLTRKMEMTMDECHIGKFTVEQCQKVVNIIIRSGIMQ